MLILGLSAYYHDSAAAIVRDGTIVAAAQEERFTRIKHDPRFPAHATRFCLDAAGARLADIDRIVFYDDPRTKFSRLLGTYLSYAPRGYATFRQAMPVWLGGKIDLRRQLLAGLAEVDSTADVAGRISNVAHHVSHTASAFFPSPFEEAVVLTMDGVGEWATTSVAVGRGNQLNMLREIRFPHSLGLLYSAFTAYTGFKVNSAEYKVMGLAPYGTPRYAALILEHLIDVKQDGSFRLAMEYFDFAVAGRMTNRRFHDLFGGPPRHPETPLTQHEMDLAASIQVALEEVVLRIVRALAREHSIPNLCLAGGVALNSVLNGKIMREGAFREVWVQPAAGDAGGALGAALAAWYGTGARRFADGHSDAMRGALLGPAFDDGDVATRLSAAGARFERQDEGPLIARTVEALTKGAAVAWFQGAMEFGPRALGNRSIIADPRSPVMQRTLNLKVKFRESFRPFAPAVLAEHAREWFEVDRDSPYMLFVAPVAEARRVAPPEGSENLFGIDMLNVPRSTIPTVTHVDHSARLQTVHHETNPRFHALLTAFHSATGCPVLANTSFNVRGEPIVLTPEDAFRCFMGTDMELAVIGPYVLEKSAQDPALGGDKHRLSFAPD